jgi:hypothetical protein
MFRVPERRGSVAILPCSLGGPPSGRDQLTRALAHRFKLATIAAALILAAGAFGCGSDGDEDGENTELVQAQKDEVNKSGEVTTPIDASDVVKGFPPQIITDGDVNAEKKGTPQRAFLEWWQAYQFHDDAQVLALTSKAAVDAIGKSTIEEMVRQSLQGVEILDVSESGSAATIDAGLLNFQPPEQGAPPPDEPTNSVPESFAMVKEGGDWVFDETAYLQLKAQALQR